MPGDEPYREIAPAARLAAHVDRFWTRRGGAASTPHRVLPDGCSDLVVDLDAGVARVVGPMTRAALVPSTGACIVAVRFRPGAGAGLAGVSLDALADEAVDAGEVGLETAALVEGLARAAPASRTGMLSRFVATRLGAADPLDRAVRRATARLAADPTLKVDALAAEVGVSRQYLGRIFARDVGVSPKTFARVARVQRLVLAIRAGRRDWTRLAADLGFADQAHLVHDARALTGLTPTELAAEVSISPIASVFGALRPPP